MLEAFEGEAAVHPLPGQKRRRTAVGAVLSSDNIPVIHQGRAGGPLGWIGMRRQEIIAPKIFVLLGFDLLLSNNGISVRPCVVFPIPRQCICYKFQSTSKN